MPLLNELLTYMSALLAEFNGQIVLSVVSFGMGVAFYSADPRSPTSKYIALFFLGVGLSISMNTSLFFASSEGGVPAWAAIGGLGETLAAIAGFEWILRIRHTVPSRDLNTRFGDNLLRVAQVIMLFYGLMSVLYPEVRLNDYLGAFMQPDVALSQKGFWLFALPIEVSLLLGGVSALMLLNRRPERAEAIRLYSFVACTPFLASGLILPLEWAGFVSAIGLMIFLVGAIHYHIHQGRRGLFMSRFLSPQVAELVRDTGLSHALQDHNHEISVVACDLRGFTAYSEASGSTKVISTLREYYDEVGEIVARHGGTIKDYAGDGILILVGAPLAYDDHAQRALRIASDIIQRVEKLTQRWSQSGPELGIGAGIASGPVTVGMIGGTGRMEYAAVGSAVNLAARLCENAAHGEILLDARSRELLGDAASQLSTRQGLQLKGFGDNVDSYALLLH
ncbi:MAG: adenylate/guanylate cyclase domain-containing protein [Salinisphaeraceae bacterium]|nr:adenylate/guanylate cyclase domain-containing protein [Salinisphaeraceae bacterium]